MSCISRSSQFGIPFSASFYSNQHHRHKQLQLTCRQPELCTLMVKVPRYYHVVKSPKIHEQLVKTAPISDGDGDGGCPEDWRSGGFPNRDGDCWPWGTSPMDWSGTKAGPGVVSLATAGLLLMVVRCCTMYEQGAQFWTTSAGSFQPFCPSHLTDENRIA